MSSIPGPGIFHMLQYRKYWACALEPGSHNYLPRTPQLLKPVLLNKRSHCNEKPMYCNQEEPPLAATTEKPEQQQRPSTIKINKTNKNLKKKKEFSFPSCVGTCKWLSMVVDLNVQFSADLKQIHLCWRNIQQSIFLRSTVVSVNTWHIEMMTKYWILILHRGSQWKTYSEDHIRQLNLMRLNHN